MDGCDDWGTPEETEAIRKLMRMGIWKVLGLDSEKDRTFSDIWRMVDDRISEFFDFGGYYNEHMGDKPKLTRSSCQSALDWQKKHWHLRGE